MNQLINKVPENRLGPQSDHSEDNKGSRGEDEKSPFYNLKYNTKWFKNFNWVWLFAFSFNFP